MEEFLLQLFIFLAAAAISVPIANKFGMGSVLGYLIAGIVIGPFGFSLIGDVESVMHFTEFGVVMMLFLVGLELKPALLLKMRVPIFGVGGTQVAVLAIIIFGIAVIFIPWQESVMIGLALALSSTALVLQTLKEKGLMQTSSGRSIFSVLLFQDLAVIPIIAVLPLLATYPTSEDYYSESVLFDISTLPGSIQFLSVIVAVLLIFIIARYLSRPVFRIIAKTRVREIFIAAALVMVVGISLLMTIVGLSPALGTFLAGVILADSEYRHELESDIEPFKGLLLGIFFISIGASLNIVLIRENLWLVIGVALSLIVIKFIMQYVIAYIYKIKKDDRTFFALALAQGGEFAFVIFALANTNGVLLPETTEPLVAAVAISMFLAPILFKLYEVISAKTQDKESKEVELQQEIPVQSKVILAGFGQVGIDIGRFLISAGIKPVILDHDADNVDLLRKLGFEVYYGDVTRLDLLESAGIADTSLLVIAIGDSDISEKLVQLVHKHYPHLKIIASSVDYTSTYKLMDLKVDKVRRATFGSALDLGQDALTTLGVDPYEAYRLMRIFKKHNDQMINTLHANRGDKYISAYQEQIANLEDMIKRDLGFDNEELDKAWVAKDPEH